MSADPNVLKPRVKTYRRSFPGLRTIAALMLREITTTNGRASGGYLWALAEPVGGIILLTLIFSIGFRSPPLGENFAIFYASGLVPFTLYTAVSSKMSMALMFSKPLLAYPTVTFADALIARFLVNAITQYLVAYFIFTGILLLYDTKTTLNLANLVSAFAMVSSLAIGIGVLNAFLFTLVPSWQQIWSILNRPMFIISCIFFVFETIPQPYRDYLWYNPLVHVVGRARSGFYPTYDAGYVSELYVYGISLTCTVIGLFFLRRYYRDLIYR